ncbi:hypothetical protein [Legionella sp. W05-934-2]|jgi:hypothetical protein|uniref:hypothetical protein n=1 Tax=Legionella sp. W05-934-2 TaxID=1198649 RepID=UPI003461C39B
MPSKFYEYFSSIPSRFPSFFSSPNPQPANFDPKAQIAKQKMEDNLSMAKWSVGFAAFFIFIERSLKSDNKGLTTFMLALAGGGILGGFLSYSNQGQRRLESNKRLSSNLTALQEIIATEIESLSQAVSDLNTHNIRELSTWASEYKSEDNSANTDLSNQLTQKQLLSTLRLLLNNQNITASQSEQEKIDITQFWAQDKEILQKMLLDSAYKKPMDTQSYTESTAPKM